MPAYNTTHLLSRLTSTTVDDNVFTSAGPLFLSFPSDEDGTNLPNLVKTAFLDALMLMLHGLPHADQGTPTSYRYFDQGDECDVKRILAHFFGNGQGLDAFCDPDKPLRIVWLDATLVGVPADQNRCLKEGAVAA